MKKFLSILILSTTLLTTTGCGKKQPKAVQPVVQQEQIHDTTAQDKKEDYALSA